MDTTKTITHVSLCAGYGGIDIGLSRAIPSLRTVAFSEIEAFACANLVSKMEAGLLDCAPIWTNLKTFPWSEFRDRVDLLSGGYPCQPFSSAGKRLGTEDPRHLWPYIADGIHAMRPRVCFFENVEGHISLGLREVISELEGIGYKVAWGIFSAREVGAPHQRKRVFILAMANNGGEGLQGNISRLLVSSRRQEQGGSVGSCCGSSGDRELADSNGAGSWEDRESGKPRADGIKQPPSDPWGSAEGEVRQEHAWPSRPGQPQHEWEPPRVVGNTQHDGSHQCGSETRGTESCGEQGWVQESEGGSASMGNATHGSNGQHTSEQQGWDTFGRPSAEGVSMGDTSMQRPQRRTHGEFRQSDEVKQLERSNAESGKWNQTQPSLGRDTDEPTSGMDYAELSVTCDNRTDELRLLGNGVVPATAERAFRTLLAELIP